LTVYPAATTSPGHEEKQHMRDLVCTGFISLDGVMDSPGGGPGEEHRSGGWVVNDIEFLPEAFALKGEELADTTALMFGRRSYEAFAPTWRDSDDHAAYRELPKYVVSATLPDDAIVDGWGPTTVLRSTEDVAELKKEDGGAIFIHGSGELARRLSDAGLIDRYHLLVFPVLLGAGKSLFSRADRDKQALRLRTSESYPNGIVKLIYDVVG
jgi:dihydrofolate reductase